MDLFETISHINTQTVVELIDGFREHRPQKQINRIIETITTYMPPAYSEEITTYIVDRAADAAGVPSPNGQIVHKEAVGRTATVTGPNGEKQTVTGEPGTSRIVQKVRTDGVPTVTAPSSEPTPQFNATNPRIMEPQPFTPNPNINRKPGGSGGSGSSGNNGSSSPLGGNGNTSPLGGNGNTSPLGGNNQTGGNGNNPLGGNTGNTGNNQTGGNPLGGYSPLGGNNSNSNSNPTGSNGGNSSNSNPNTTTNNDNDNDNAGSGEIPLNYLAP
ncbi:hypothetical protein ECANGB1_1817 [Enterospora canceri]|uniref:Uncharacterized protein n=1 Tax=Enterospora canceri TaxID=1081671 RepID=A0A1Y1S4K1_9MICR|nr:hypothetical protein ECANGB1_1817 [Enterospora canceri]